MINPVRIQSPNSPPEGRTFAQWLRRERDISPVDLYELAPDEYTKMVDAWAKGVDPKNLTRCDGDHGTPRCLDPECHLIDLEWEVYGTSLAPASIMVRCRITGATGLVKDYTKAEWMSAYYAPSAPYPWVDTDRVVPT
jgi:hypothetical protein